MKKKYDLIFVGRIAKQKRLDTVVEIGKYAQKKGKDISICIVGNGPLESWLLLKIKKYHLKSIRYIGYLVNPLEYIKDSRLLVLPSDYEACPTVVLEAGSVGTPSVLSNFSGYEDLIKNRSGWVIKKRSHFPAKVIRLLENTKEIPIRGKRMKRRVEKLFNKKNLVKFVKLILSQKNSSIHSYVFVYWSLGLGGIEQRLPTIIHELVRQDKKSKVNIFLKRMSPQHSRKFLESAHVKTHFYSSEIVSGKPLRFGLWLISQLVLLDPSPQILIAFMNKFALIAVIAKFISALRNRKIEVIVSQESYLSSYLKDQENWYWKYLCPLIYHFVDKIIVMNKASEKDLIYNFGVSKSKIFLVRGWVPRLI